MERQAKGNILHSTGRYIDTEVEPHRREAVWSRVPAATRELLPTVARGKFYPLDHVAQLWRALGTTHDTPDAANDELFRLGKAMGSDATSGALRLVVKLLNPKIFAARCHKFFRRDFNFGEVAVPQFDQAGGRMSMVLSGMEGFDYVGRTAGGWFCHALESMGTKGVNVDVQQAATVSVAEQWAFEVTWEP